MFSGESIHALDAKWRVFLPKRIQTLLPRDEEGQAYAILSRGFDRCISLHTQEGFEAEVADLERTVFAGPEGRAAQRLFFSSVFRQPLDSSGRLLVPDSLRQQIGLGEREEVALVGVDRRFELWRLADWRRYQSAHDAAYDELMQRLAGRPTHTDVPGEGG